MKIHTDYRIKTPLNDADRKKLAEKLQKLQSGERVKYRCWRGGEGEGVFLHFVGPTRQKVQATRWGNNSKDGLIVKRDFSADDGYLFLPFSGEDSYVKSILMIAEEVM